MIFTVGSLAILSVDLGKVAKVDNSFSSEEASLGDFQVLAEAMAVVLGISTLNLAENCIRIFVPFLSVFG